MALTTAEYITLCKRLTTEHGTSSTLGRRKSMEQAYFNHHRSLGTMVGARYANQDSLPRGGAPHKAAGGNSPGKAFRCPAKNCGQKHHHTVPDKSRKKHKKKEPR